MIVEPLTQPVRSLYVHVPFCAQKCSYCAFYSEASSGELVNRYVRALLREFELIAADLKPETIFFGGGTPSLLNLKQWGLIFEQMERLGLLGASEWTIECNPATVSLDKAQLFRRHGVNRVSMGVQSLNEALLNKLGRIHSREMVYKSFDILRQAGFDNLNLDLMFAIPGQSLEVWRETLDEALAFNSEHLSTYEVIYEDDTPLFAQLKAGEIAEDEDLACAMHEELVEKAIAAGLQQYEVANFARARSPGSTDDKALKDAPTYSCRHNLNYWRGGSFYGLGPSATSYVRGVRTKNWSNTTLYCDQLEKGKRAVESSEQLSPLSRAGETAAFGLRMTEGIEFEAFRQITGKDLRKEWAADMKALEQRGWAQILPKRFHLTSEGLRFADSAAELFLR
jgi:oxygen-independent coproporphyrinogen-3 oxidase